MVRGSRHNHTVQFKHLYPKTGGGEDVGFVFQMKKFYKTNGFVVAVPEALVNHPYWNNGGTCYGQIGGWANGDSLVLSEWPEKTFLVFPNWIESTFLVVLVYGGFWWKYMTSDTTILSPTDLPKGTSTVRRIESSCGCIGLFLPLGQAPSSRHKITRALCKVKCGSLCSFAHRMD
jgi:hypothetical protein